MYGNKKYFRADHAHKKCNQILVPVSGKVRFKLQQKKVQRKI